MPASSTVLVDQLRRARVTKLATARRLRFEFAVSVRREDRIALRDHLVLSRLHATRIDERIRALGIADEDRALRRGLGLGRELVEQTVAFWKSPVDFVLAGTAPRKALRTALAECSGEALEVATFTALARMAEMFDDTETADLARSIRDDDGRMFQQHLARVPELVDLLVAASDPPAAAHDDAPDMGGLKIILT